MGDAYFEAANTHCPICGNRYCNSESVIHDRSILCTYCFLYFYENGGQWYILFHYYKIHHITEKEWIKNEKDRKSFMSFKKGISECY